MKNFSKTVVIAALVTLVGVAAIAGTSSIIKTIEDSNAQDPTFVYPEQDLSNVFLGKVDFRTDVTTTSAALAKERFDTILSDGLSQGDSAEVLAENFTLPTLSSTESQEFISKAYVGNNALKLGTSTEDGYFQINVSNAVSKVVVKARNYYYEPSTGVYTSDATSIGIGLTSAIATTELPRNLADTSVLPAVLDVSYTFASAPSTIYISAIDGRAIIYEINFYTDALQSYNLVNPEGIVSADDEYCDSVDLFKYSNIEANAEALFIDPEAKTLFFSSTYTAEDALDDPFCIVYYADSVYLGHAFPSSEGLFTIAGTHYYLRDTFTGWLIGNTTVNGEQDYLNLTQDFANGQSLVLYKQA